MNTTTQTASLKNVKKVFMIATAAEAIFYSVIDCSLCIRPTG